jgi:hypothetical protein
MKRSFLLLLAALTVPAMVGCGSSFKNLNKISKSSILVLPARDATQNGAWHPYEAGKSGTLLTDNLCEDLTQQGWNVLRTENPSFTNRVIPPVPEQIEEATNLGANYVLYVVLGEFLDAAPMTFRPDLLTLEAATLYDARNGELVWTLAAPKKYDGSNPPKVWRFIPAISRDIARSISR